MRLNPNIEIIKGYQRNFLVDKQFNRYEILSKFDKIPLQYLISEKYFIKYNNVSFIQRSNSITIKNKNIIFFLTDVEILYNDLLYYLLNYFNINEVCLKVNSNDLNNKYDKIIFNIKRIKKVFLLVPENHNSSIYQENFSNFVEIKTYKIKGKYTPEFVLSYNGLTNYNKVNLFFYNKIILDSKKMNLMNDLSIFNKGYLNLMHIFYNVTPIIPSKSRISVCSTCEFRGVCLDYRIPLKQIDDTFFYDNECSYNPYIAKWEGEVGYRTLAECGVISNEEGFFIDHERIAEINRELWGEDVVN